MKSKYLYPLRVLKQTANLPRHIRFFETQNTQRQNEVTELRAEISELKTALADNTKAISALHELLRNIDDRLAALQGKVRLLKPSQSQEGIRQSVNNTIADDHSLDHFYKLFEDRFRGSEASIKERVSEHLPLFTSLDSSIKKLPIADIGSGRGEFLSVLKDAGLHPIGIDMNKSMVDRAIELGFESYQDDALSYLLARKANSLAAITGFHIVEHIPFDSLVQLFDECYRTVTPGGLVLFETPNPQNLAVGACNFYMDPSHIKPVPPALLAFALETAGFTVEIHPLHPAKDEIEHTDSDVKDIMNMLYGPLDYAVVARKK